MLSEEVKEIRERMGKLYYEANENCIKYEKIVEKQQKEIEELKEKIGDEKIFIQFGEIIEKKRWKNKIKAKIEEIKDGTYDAKIILQKLLEE